MAGATGAVARDPRALYGAPTVTEAEAAVERVALTWDGRDPTISTSWRRDWPRLTVFFDDPPAIRKVIDTTNAIESLKYSWRNLLKKRGAFPRMKPSSTFSIWVYRGEPRNGRLRFLNGNEPSLNLP